jgi:crotonobetainyl-CoA:carnitine CoA-transferase CaiB-like acyl-CoA transferase
MAGPLAGIRVLDFCHFLAGPYATLVLADLGAEVIKVEDPDHPDEARAIGPCWQEGYSLYFASLNWGKRSFAARLADPDGHAAVLDLVRTADAVVDNFRPGVMAKLGLDHESLAAANPRVVSCSLTSYGETGPYAPRPGYDYTVQALSGVMSLTGEPDGPPGKAGISYVDHAGGLAAALAVTAALLARGPDGPGTHVDLGLLDVQISMLTYLASWELNGGFAPGRTRSGSHPSIVPAQNFATRDGHIALFVGNDSLWRKLVPLVDEPALADEELTTGRGRFEHRERVVALLAGAFARRETQHWVDTLVAAGVPCAPINEVGEALADDQVLSRALVRESEHPAYGSYRHTRGPIPALAVDGERGAPLMGEDTASLLAEMGYDGERIERLAG